MNQVIRNVARFAVIMVLACSLSACASINTSQQTGFLGEYYKNLEKGPDGGVKSRWIKSGVDFSKYDKVMFDDIVFYFDPKSEDKGIDAVVMKDLSDAFMAELMNAVKDKYQIVSEPGPNVARFKFALTGIKQSRPVISGVTSVIPVGLAASTIKKGVSDEWIGSGATGMEAIVFDSMTNEVIAAGKDEQTAGFTERFSKYGSAKVAFKFWAGRLRTLMDKLHDIK